MLKEISQKIQMAYALVVVFFLCRLDDTKKKLHINYSVRGLATIGAVDKLELTDESEIFYIDPYTAQLTKQWDQGYYARNKLVRNEDPNWQVDLNSFRAKVQSKIDPEKTITINREEFKTYDLLPSQARVCLPDGKEIVITKQQANDLIAGKIKIADLKGEKRQSPLVKKIIQSGKGLIADDVDEALPIAAN